MLETNNVNGFPRMWLLIGNRHRNLLLRKILRRRRLPLIQHARALPETHRHCCLQTSTQRLHAFPKANSDCGEATKPLTTFCGNDKDLMRSVKIWDETWLRARESSVQCRTLPHRHRLRDHRTDCSLPNPHFLTSTSEFLYYKLNVSTTLSINMWCHLTDCDNLKNLGNFS